MGDYNKPITARIQQSTSRGMKIQEPLLDIGSVANANAALIQGEKAAAGRTPDAAGAFKAGMSRSVWSSCWHKIPKKNGR